MNAEKFKSQLSNIPQLQEVYIQIGDNAYPAKVRFFNEGGKVIPYVCLDNTLCHRNFPDGYSGAEEVFFREK